MKVMHKEYMKPLLKEWNFLDWNYPRKRHEYFRFEDIVVQEKLLIFQALHISIVRQEKATTQWDTRLVVKRRSNSSQT